MRLPIVIIVGILGWAVAGWLWTHPRESVPIVSGTSPTPVATRGMTAVEEEAGVGVIAYGKRHAFVVGVNRYAPPFGTLAAPAHDASEVAAVLADRFGFERVTLLIDTPPTVPQPAHVTVERLDLLTGAALRERLSAFRDGVGPRDAACLFYAGHGVRVGEHGYLVPADGNPAQPTTLIDLAQLAGAVRAWDAHHTLLVLDCCYSGTALEPSAQVEASVGMLAERSMGANIADNLGRVFNRRGFQVITAGSGRETVDDVVRGTKQYAELAALPEFQGHSPFTAVLLQALRGLTGRPDGKLLASDLGYFMNATLVNDERIGARQAPRSGSIGQSGGEFTFLPARKVLNPRLISPLYLTGRDYAELRRSAVAALGQVIAAEPEADRPALTRSALPHWVRLLEDPVAGPRQVAAEALAESAARYGAESPDYQPAVTRLVRLIEDAAQPSEVQQSAARALGVLTPWATDAAVVAMRTYLTRREAEWKGHVKSVAQRLRIPVERFRLPEELTRAAEQIVVPAVPAANAPAAERLRYENARRTRQDFFSPQGLDPYLRRHDQGLAWVERAQKLLGEKDVLRARMTLAAALGFEEYGERPPEAFRGANRPLLFPETPAWKMARKLLIESPHAEVAWITPTPPSEPVLAITRDGSRMVVLTDDASLSVRETATGKAVARIVPRTNLGKTYSLGYALPCAFSPDGSRFAALESDKIVTVWNLTDGKELLHWDGLGSASAVAFLPNNDTLALADEKTLRLRDISTGTLHSPREAPETITALCIPEQGGRIFAAVGNNTLQPAKLYAWPIVGKEATVSVLPGRAPVYRFAAAPDGNMLAFAMVHTGVLLWNADAGKPITTLEGHLPFNNGFGPQIMVLAVAFSADGQTLASTANDSTVRLYDVRAASQTHVLHVPSVKPFLAFDPTGEALLVPTIPQTLRRWKVRSGQEIEPHTGHVGSVFGMAISPDGKRVASGGYDGTIRLWNAVDGKLSAILHGHTKSVSALAWSPDGTRLVSAGFDRTVRLWSGEGFAESKVVLTATNGLRALACSPDGKLFAASGDDSVIRLCNADGEPQGTLEGHEPTAGVYTLAFSPDGRLLVSCALKFGAANPTGDPSMRFWDVASRKLLDKGALRRAQMGVAFAPDGAFVSIGNAAEIRQWGADRKLVRTVTAAQPYGKAVAYSADGSHFVTAFVTTIQLWDARTGLEIVRLTGHARDQINRIAFAPDGRSLYSAGDDGTVRRWEFAVNRPLMTWAYSLPPAEADKPTPRRGAITALAWTKPGREFVAAGQDGAIRRWDIDGNALPAGDMGKILEGKRWVSALARSPDGKILASGHEDGVVRLWNASDGAAIGTWLQRKNAITSLAFSPDGTTLAAGDAVGTVGFRSMQTGEPLGSDWAFGWPITGLCFAPDGRNLAIGTEFQTAVLIAWPSEKETQRFRYPLNGVLPSTFVRFSANGEQLAIGWVTGAITVWNVSAGKVQSILEVSEDMQRADCAFTADGKRLILADKSAVRVFDAETGQEIIALTDWPSSPRAMLMLPDGAGILLGTEAGTVERLSMPKAESLWPFRSLADFADDGLRWRIPTSGR